MEDKTPKIYAAICGVMEDIGAVGKNDVNKQQGFKYRGIDAVMNALNPAMVKHKIFCAPEVMEQNREERKTVKGNTVIYSVCRIRYRFFTTDGSSVETIVVGEAMDSGDKATNKAMSVAFKYACFQVFCIPTEELMDDPDKDTPEETTGKTSDKTNKPPEQLISEKQAECIRKEMERTGTTIKKVLDSVGKKVIMELTVQDYKKIMDKFKRTPDKTPPNPPPEGDPYYEGLPFN